MVSRGNIYFQKRNEELIQDIILVKASAATQMRPFQAFAFRIYRKSMSD